MLARGWQAQVVDKLLQESVKRNFAPRKIFSHYTALKVLAMKGLNFSPLFSHNHDMNKIGRLPKLRTLKKKLSNPSHILTVWLSSYKGRQPETKYFSSFRQ